MSTSQTDRILDSYKDGAIERRAAVRQLALCFAAAFAFPSSASARESAAEFGSTGLNHLALRVTDVARSRDFYIKNFGLTVLRDNSPGNCFLGCGDNFLALFRSETAAMDHFCLTIDDYDPADVLQRLETLGIETHRVENRVYFKDPDGLEGQIASPVSPWPG